MDGENTVQRAPVVIWVLLLCQFWKEGNIIKGESYEEFVEKFKPKKTTDDCYTPPEIYEVIKGWVCEKYKIDPSKILRPFWPGGDYQNEEYPAGCLVLDNPPFSILSKICEFYIERNIKFFLFAPSLTAFSGKKVWDKMNHIICDCSITYENGAVVRTSFVTNCDKETIAQTAPDLTRIVNEKMKEIIRKGKKELPKYDYPEHVVTAAMMQRYTKYGIDFSVKRGECVRISRLDAQKLQKKEIFGSGLLLSERKASEKAAAEKAAAEKAAAEKAAAEKFTLSEREMEIVKSMV